MMKKVAKHNGALASTLLKNQGQLATVSNILSSLIFIISYFILL